MRADWSVTIWFEVLFTFSYTLILKIIKNVSQKQFAKKELVIFRDHQTDNLLTVLKKNMLGKYMED